MLKICEENSSVNLRLEIFVMAFRVRKLFGTFEKRAPGPLNERLSLPNPKFFLGTSINFPLRRDSTILTCEDNLFNVCFALNISIAIALI